MVVKLSREHCRHVAPCVPCILASPLVTLLAAGSAHEPTEFSEFSGTRKIASGVRKAMSPVSPTQVFAEA